ncbi:outer membrane beta-barrel protein [Pseudoflavitalea sp. X16]|uniref:outer membrane beta-barrel protein n=1 Tax=Paraflavitalea devenefica TaxID=2716334 RepID=UPI001422EB52|nr:outer membrane beta-barrel protein [Paraflavitalea devenefica]NII28985.1 outer membrane beta-barrel protein [Paraflavitalea devenefica]
MKTALILLAIVLLSYLVPAQDTRTLKVVTVKGRKPVIEQKMDRTIVHVDAMISAAGSNALEVLARSPGVMISQDDQISLNGRGGVVILLDNRPTYLPAGDVAAYLRSLPAGVIDKIELIHNPPASYDAAGGAIINIVLKKNKQQGFHGNLQAGMNQGVHARYNNSFNGNYRKGKSNIFGYVAYSRDKNYSEETIRRDYFRPDGTPQSAVLLDNYSRSTVNTWNGRLGIDYFLSRNTTLGFMVTGSTQLKKEQFDFHGRHVDGAGKPDSTALGYTGGSYTWRNIGANLNFQHKLDSMGQQLSGDADLIQYYADGEQYLRNDTWLPDGQVSSSWKSLFVQPASTRIRSLKADYVLPFKGNARVEAGAKISNVRMDNEARWYDQINGSNVPDYRKTNDFRYTETISTAYVNARKEWKRWGLQAGLRLEDVRLKGQQPGNALVAGSAFYKHYSTLFPSFYLSYKLDSTGNSTLVLSYGKRIRRPNYQQLNPFLLYRDNYSYTGGNPDLLPGFSHYYDLRYSYREFLSVTAGYNRDEQLPYGVTQATDGIFITRPMNLVNSDSYTLVLYGMAQPARWWTVRGNLLLFWVHQQGGAGEIKIDRHTTVREIEVSSEWQLGKGWRGEITGFFPGRQGWGQTQNDAIYAIGAGLQKTLFDGKGSIRLKADDIFKTKILREQTLGIQQVTAFRRREFDSRRFGIAVSWRLGKDTNARKRRHDSGGAKDEEGRVN